MQRKSGPGIYNYETILPRQSARGGTMYVITGATGNTGSVVAEKLLAAGQKIRVIGRDAKRLERFTKKGAEASVADATDAEALTKAFSGAEAVYAIVPPNISSPDVSAYQERVTDALASAIDKNGVRYAVVLSSFGADKPDKTGPVAGLRSLEEKLGRISGLHALYLRAGYFMENILAQVGVIKSLGIMAGPVRADLALPMIATRDIGAAAAHALLKLNFEGKSARELQGARDVTYAEVAKTAGVAIERPDLSYKQAPAGMLKPAMLQMGMSSSMVDLLLEMSDALNSGHMKALEPRSVENTTPTTIETFIAEVFVPAYQGKAASA
ncbi:MAG: NAD(P)H-binding protein [Candidatus Acidiferrales bacterium]